MKASLSTIRYLNGQYGGTEKDLLVDGIDSLVGLATNRLGGLEGYVEYGKRFDGIVVAKVVSCVPHDGSDHLHVCMIDDGGATKGVERDKDGHVQVVCGAPNVREGLTVAWIPPGSTVPSSLDEAEAFVLSKREIRGKVSNGMLASPSELGLYDNHDGILEIDESEVGAELMKPGSEFKKLYGLDDVLLEFENKMFTHRPDCFGQIGLARELAAIQGMKYTSPDWYWKHPRELKINKSQDIRVFNDVDSVVPRIMAVAMNNVSVGESPVWLKSFITRMGGKPVNNVVDVSNYIMHITSQPTHAYDLSKLEEATIGARMANKGETINLLNGKTVELTEDDIVIADQNKPVGIAGIMGGSDTEVDASTTSILLEVASFDMYTIRRSAMRHGLFTDAFTRFSKGQSPLQNDRVMDKFISMLSEVCGAKVSSELVDLKSENTKKQDYDGHVHPPVRTTVEFINSRLGTSLSADEIKQLLRNVEMAILDVDDELEIYAPHFRTDIELPEDIVEEVGRLYGFDRLEPKLPLRSIKPAKKNELNEFKSKLRNKLACSGANEVLSYSFVHSDTLTRMGIADPDTWCHHLRNAISPELQYYRPCLLPSLLTKVQQNLRSDMVRSDDNDFALFELGKVHVKGHNDDDGLPLEMERLALIFVADDKTSDRKYFGSAFYQAKEYLISVIGNSAEFNTLDTNDYPITSAYEKNRSATVAINGQVLGIVGELRASVKKAFKLPNYSAAFEIDLSLLRDNLSETGYEPIGTYPKVQQDITFAVDKDVNYAKINELVRGKFHEEGTAHGYKATIKTRDIFQKDADDKVHITFRVWIHHTDKTLKIEETNRLLDAVAEKALTELKAERI